MSTTTMQLTPQEQAQLEGMIPEKRFADIYTHRYVQSPVNGAKYYDFAVFDSARAKKHNVMLPGPTGAGKTTAARAYAAHREVPFVSVEFSGSFSYSEVIGAVMSDENRVPRFVKGELTLALTVPSVVNFAEVSFAHGKSTAATHGVLDARQTLYIPSVGMRVQKHPDCLIIADYNPGYLGTSLLNQAFRNRFMYTLPWGYDAGVEDVRVGVHSPTLLEMVRNMRTLPEMDGVDIGTNLMEEFILMARTDGIGLASFAFLNHFDTDLTPSVSDSLTANLWEIANELKVEADG